MISLQQYYAEVKETSGRLEGLALDIDDTLCATSLDLAEIVLKTFGNPEGLTAQELIEKYGHFKNVPYFGEKIQKWIDKKIIDTFSNESLPAIENAAESIAQITKVVPISCYITGRPPSVKRETIGWLDKHDFPKKPINFQPEARLLRSWGIKDGCQWKARLLEYLYPQVEGIIDDNPDLIRYIKKNYPGRIYLLSSEKIQDNLLNLHLCRDWSCVVNQIQNPSEL